jgi:hypothetical protein
MNRAQRKFLDATVRPGTRGRSHTAAASWARNRSHRMRPRLTDEWFARPRAKRLFIVWLDHEARS